jgi:type I restriction enzyme R subunit
MSQNCLFIQFVRNLGEGRQASYKTTENIFQRQLHAYTITDAIEDGNVLRFHIDYYKPEGNNIPNPGEALAKRAIVEAILEKHDAATASRKFNAILATASINDAIAYYDLFKTTQAEKQAADPDFHPLNVACVFSPPAEGNKDVKQIQEDLPQEKVDNQEAPEEKKAALKLIIADYNARYATNYNLSEFDLYYQDVQKRIKDQQYSNQDLPRAQKIDITIVVDMLLTGFDSKFLNTLYVDKNLKYHGLIQAFSRTNRVLNDTKPYGNILDFRQQQEFVDEAIKLFSGEHQKPPEEIWLVDPALVVIGKLEAVVKRLDSFMQSQGLQFAPEEVPNLKGDAARSQFIKLFKEVQRLKIQLDQYTDLTPDNKEAINAAMPKEQLQAFRGVYLEIAQRLKARQGKDGGVVSPEMEQLDFEFVLFASAVIDYDYIIGLIVSYTQEKPDRQKMTRDQLIGLIQSDAKFINEDIVAYIETLPVGEALDETAIRKGYEQFKAQKNADELATIATKHGLEPASLQTFVDGIRRRLVFDGEQLSDLLAPLQLGWKARAKKEQALMADLIPLLHKLAEGLEIAGLGAYEQ